MNVRLCFPVLILASLPLAAAAADTGAQPNAAKIFDQQLSSTEREFVSLVEAMPADKFNFAPSQEAGAFKGVRTFAQQATHAAFTLNSISSAMLGEKNPSASGPNENGPANLKSKEEVVKYVKDAFAYAHRAIGTLTNSNLLEQTADPFDPKARSARVDSASMMFWHTFDHYGQMVEYARMNNVIPPASR